MKTLLQNKTVKKLTNKIQSIINNKHVMDKPIYCVMGLSILLRMSLAMRLPYNGIANAGFDDAWLVRAAEQISIGNWLGSYDCLTLIKGISFPMFLVAAKVLCIPYGMMLTLLYILAAVVTIVALKDQVKNRCARCLIFLWILYSPIGFASSTGMRIYRNSILLPAVLLVVATTIGLMKAREKSKAEMTVWALGLGVSFTFFYYIREDSIWLVPFVAVILVWNVVVLLSKTPVDKHVCKNQSAIACKLIRIAIMCTPILVFVLVTLAYCTMNYRHYGVFTTNDRTKGAFSDVVGAMLRVKEVDETLAESEPAVWISRATMERIVEECPTLEEHHYDYMFMYDACAEGKTNANGDYYAWGFRQEIGKLGFDSDAIAMQHYCQQVADEINLALDEGRLQSDDQIHFSGQTRGLTSEQCIGLVKDSLGKMVQMALFRDDFDARAVAMSSGTREQYRYFESMTGVQVVYPQENALELRGWIYLKNPDEQITLDLVDSEATVLMHGISLYESKNVARYTGDEHATMAQFDMTLQQVTWIEYAHIAVYRDGELYQILPIENYEDDVVRLNVDAFQIATYDDAKIGMSGYAIKIANIFVKLGKLLAYPLLLIAILGYVASIVTWFREKTLRYFEDFMIMTGCILSFFVCVFMVGVFAIGWLDSLNMAIFYGVGAYGFLYIFEIYGLSQILHVIVYKNRLHTTE